MSHITLRRAAAFTVSTAWFCAAVYSQTITGRIVGTVSDASQSAVPEASITITNQETGVAWHMKSDAHGDYVSP